MHTMMGPRAGDKVHNRLGTAIYLVESFGYDPRARDRFVSARRTTKPMRLRTFLLRDLEPMTGEDNSWVEY